MPGSEDRFDGSNCFIITNPSQIRFHLYGDDPNELRIADIAGAISKQCRFTGHLHVDCWYSVAEHCLLVSTIVAMRGGSEELQYAALMHDTPEAYLADLAAPFKRELGKYYEKEELVWKRIAAKYDLPMVLPKEIKDADWLALFIEARNIVLPGNEAQMHSWVGWDQWGEESKKFDIKPWLLNPAQARDAWLRAYVQLRKL